MRAYEFITEAVLLEYKREITAQRLGDALYNKFMAEPLSRQIAVIDNKDLIDMDQQMDPEQRKSGVVDELLKKLERADPSPNKQYMQWLVRNYIKGTWLFENVLSVAAGRDLRKFYDLLVHNRLKSEHRDINQIKGFVDLIQVVRFYPNIEPEKKQVDRGQYREIYSDAAVRVIQPLDETAACYYGQGTEWCTAATESENYFNSYNSQGPLYILIPKKAKHAGEKYQLHFADGQYMNENDSPVALKKLLTERFPGLDQVFLKIHPELAELVSFAPDKVLVGLWKLIGERVKQLLKEEFQYSKDYDRHYLEYKAENPNVSYDEYLKISHGKDYVYTEENILDNIDYIIRRTTAADIRDYSEQTSRETGDSIQVSQLPSEFLNSLDGAGVVSERVLDTLRRKQMAVYDINSEMYKTIIDIRRFYEIGQVDNYIFGELGGFRR